MRSLFARDETVYVVQSRVRSLHKRGRGKKRPFQNMYTHTIQNMNEYIYYVIICRYIDRRDRVICSRRDRHLLALRIPRQIAMNASVYIHLGTPCYRYCICRYFNDENRIEAYNRDHPPTAWGGYYPL